MQLMNEVNVVFRYSTLCRTFLDISSIYHHRCKNVFTLFYLK